MNPIPSEQVERIRELKGFNDKNIAEKLGLGWMIVRRYRVDVMGLPARSIHTPMSLKKRAKAVRKTMRIDTGGRMNYCRMSNELRAMGLGWPDRTSLTEATVLHVLLENGAMETPDMEPALFQLRSSIKDVQTHLAPVTMLHEIGVLLCKVNS